MMIFVEAQKKKKKHFLPVKHGLLRVDPTEPVNHLVRRPLLARLICPKTDKVGIFITSVR